MPTKLDGTSGVHVLAKLRMRLGRYGIFQAAVSKASTAPVGLLA